MRKTLDQIIQSDHFYPRIVKGHLPFERVTDHHPKKVISRSVREGYVP